jgi:hypothetical protein
MQVYSLIPEILHVGWMTYMAKLIVVLWKMFFASIALKSRTKNGTLHYT